MTDLDFSQYKHIFRAYDVRGIYNKDISSEVFYRIGLAFGTYIQTVLGLKVNQDHVYVAYDIRSTSSLLVQAFMSGLMTTGVSVDFSGEPLQFGACMFSAWRQSAFAIAFVTASHLPPEWNGVKFYFGNGVGFSESDNMAIRDIFLAGKFSKAEWSKSGLMSILNLKNEYRAFLSKKFNITKSLKVVVDCGNGSSCLSAPEILRSAGLNVVPLFCQVDPTFPNRPSEPNEKSLKILAEKVKAEKADFGVGFDGDGDRAVIVDDKGRVLLSDITGLILAKYMLQEDPTKKRVIINVECSLAIEKELADKAEVNRIKVGHTFLTETAQKFPDTVIGIESSGHMVFPSVYLFDDAQIIPLKLAEILSKVDEPLSNIVESLPKLFKRKIAVPAPDDIKFEVISSLLENLKLKYDNINNIDGIGIPFGKESWVLIRASNTGPKIRIIVESESDDQADNLITEFEKQLQEKINELQGT